ncbi:HD-GYP domain-containing protein [Streptomyces sp. WMMB 322]|uniref:HD-GYP domain-containing protein n=1 Tax=Streptomyces sp. WMMB 322 TaxID=1286821 RepID=UPI000823BA8A|nr:HD-GYP domain-containing protein [Streptomyces sp. WMMB 322]SCK31666.1 HDIG domain-containing protein [Streptomyces sp. WMMB 322]
MRAGRVGLPWAARGLIVCAASVALWCAAPALLDLSGVEWGVLVPLAALYAICELLPRCPLVGHRIPGNMGAFFPVLLTGAFLLPPAAAALVPLPGALAGRVEPRHAAARRGWHAAQLALAAWASAHVCALFDCGLSGLAQESPSGPGPASLPGFPAFPAAAVAAGLTFCAVVTLLDGAVLVAAERCAPRAAWRGQFQRAVPPQLLHGFVGLMMAVLWRSPYGPAAAFFVLLPMYICCWAFAQYHRERGAHQSTIRALVQAVDIKDRYTRGHSERVGRASALIARELGMDEERTEALRFAGILHDVGKLGVPTRLLRKEGPLTPEERRVIELHPEYGHEMVRGIGFLEEARAAILHHHERLDGSGYPYGLAGAEIPEFARVVAVADAFDAMTSTRSYRRARPVGSAVAELKRCAGTQFDPRMVRALAGALDRQGWSPAVTADRTGGNVPVARNPAEPAERAEPVERAERVEPVEPFAEPVEPLEPGESAERGESAPRADGAPRAEGANAGRPPA